MGFFHCWWDAQIPCWLSTMSRVRVCVRVCVRPQFMSELLFLSPVGVALCNYLFRVSTGHWRGSCRDPYWLNPAPCPASPSLPQSPGCTSPTSSVGVHFAGRPCRPPPATWRPARCHLQVNCHQSFIFILWKYFFSFLFLSPVFVWRKLRETLALLLRGFSCQVLRTFL